MEPYCGDAENTGREPQGFAEPSIVTGLMVVTLYGVDRFTRFVGLTLSRFYLWRSSGSQGCEQRHR
jgi:hypothetical protein